MQISRIDADTADSLILMIAQTYERERESEMESKLLYDEITEKIIGAAFEVHNALGKGLTEKTYQNALVVKLRKLGLVVDEEKHLPLFFDNVEVGSQREDAIVEEKIIIETKAVQRITPQFANKLLSTLRNTKYQLA